MALSIRSTLTLRAVPRLHRSAIVPRSSVPDDIAAGALHTFTPLRTNNKDNWEGTGTPFTGDIKHHGEAGSRRPFKDGWTSQPQAVGKKDAAVAEEPAAAPQEPNAVDYINEAAENVVAHNFTGDKTEPEHWKKPEGNSVGWKGDIHTRDRDGFHASKQ